MLKNLIFELKSYKKIAIFGFGKEGRSFYEFAKKHLENTKLIIVDKNRPQDIKEGKNLEFYSDENYLNGLEEAKLIIKSPGISLYNLGIEYDKYNFTSTSELFLKYYKNQIIGVTGTKGKSTLVSIIYSMLKNAQKDVVLCGNIGTPAFDMIDSIDKNTVIVMELSSHQLLNVKYSPHISILTNLFQDHLDYYKSLKEYYDAKFNIFRFQESDDYLLLNLKEPFDCLNSLDFRTKNVFNLFGNELSFPIKFNIKNGFIHKSSLQILEQLIKILNINENIYLKTINEFKTLPHRLEYVDTIDEIIFINDSISTIPEATIEAIKILKDVQTLVLGGYNRGIEYSFLVKFLLFNNIKNIVLFSETGKIIYDELKKVDTQKNIVYVNSLKDAVKKIFELSEKSGGIVLFSPAASSFNEYKNFMQRGDEFKRLVKETQTS